MTLVLVLRNTGGPGVARAVQLGDIEGTGEDGGPASSVAVDVSRGGAGFGARFQNGNQLGDHPLPAGWHVVTVVLDTGQTYGDTRVTLDGQDAAFLYYTRALDDEELAELHGELMQRYTISQPRLTRGEVPCSRRLPPSPFSASPRSPRRTIGPMSF